MNRFFKEVPALVGGAILLALITMNQTSCEMAVEGEVQDQTSNPIAYDLTLNQKSHTGLRWPIRISGQLPALIASHRSEDLHFEIESWPQTGSISLNTLSGEFTYQSPSGLALHPGEIFTESFTFRAGDGFKFSNLATVTVIIEEEF